MRVNRLPSRATTFLVLLLSLAASAGAQTVPAPGIANIRIDNFGQVDDAYYRGAQPKGQDFVDLAALGVRTVIDLTRDGKADEQHLVERQGMKFYRIPLTTSERPDDAAVVQFMSLVTDPANQPVFVHCQGGRHRTGAMTAVYRMTQSGWTADRAYQEMKQYKFEGFPAHPELKAFVYSYYTALGQARTTPASGTTAAAPAEALNEY